MRRVWLINIALAVMTTMNIIIAGLYIYEVERQGKEISDLRHEILEIKKLDKVEWLSIPEEREEYEYRGEYQEEVEE